MTTAGMKLIKGDDRRRFMSKVDKTETCWLWTGSQDTSGYALFWLSDRMTKAHRYAYQWHVGPIPKGLVIDHLCRVRHCVNPSHMEVVTNRVNVLRGVSPAARQAAQKTCHRGHPFDEANTYRWRNSRQCRACRKFVNRGAGRAA